MLALRSLLGCLGVAFLVGFAPRVDGRADFEAALARATKLADAGKFAETRKETLAALGAHEGQSYVKERVDDVKALMKRGYLGLACPPRKLQDVLCGEVVAYDAKKGEIELRYRKSKPKDKGAEEPPFPCGDFERQGADRDLIVPFVGPYTVELKGSGTGEVQPWIRVGVSATERYEVGFNAFGPTEIFYHRGDARGSGRAYESCVFNPTRAYAIKIVLGKDKLDAAINGKHLHVVKNELADFGRVGFRDLLGLEDVRVFGKVDVAWIDARLVAVDAECRAKAEKDYDPTLDLPEWLR